MAVHKISADDVVC